MTLCSQQVCRAGSFMSTGGVLSHSFMSPAIFECSPMLCAHLHMFGVPAWLLDWARLHLSALTGKHGVFVAFRYLLMDCVKSAIIFVLL